MFNPFILAAIAGKKRPGQPAFSLKEAVWMLVAGAAAFAGLFLAFWVYARSVLL